VGQLCYPGVVTFPRSMSCGAMFLDDRVLLFNTSCLPRFLAYHVCLPAMALTCAFTILLRQPMPTHPAPLRLSSPSSSSIYPLYFSVIYPSFSFSNSCIDSCSKVRQEYMLS